MRFASSLALALGLSVVTACGKSSTAPSLGLTVAEATATCAPTDGPAVAIRFTSSAGESPTPPIVQAAVYRPRAELAGKQWTLPSDQAHVWLQRTPSLEFDPATEGRITIDAVEADGAIRGSITARFPDGTRFERRFRATWTESAPVCA